MEAAGTEDGSGSKLKVVQKAVNGSVDHELRCLWQFVVLAGVLKLEDELDDWHFKGPVTIASN